MKKTVLIADSEAQFCSKLSAALDSCGHFEIVGLALDGKQAIQMIKSKQPDMLVLDLMLSKQDGISVLKAVSAMDKPPATLATSKFVTDFVASAAANLGVRYLMIKPCDIPTIVERLEEMGGNKKLCRSSHARSDHARIEPMVTKILLDIGVPAHIKGYHYLREAIIIAVNDTDVLNAVTKVLYPRVAKLFDTTPARVSRAIAHAVECAWAHGDSGKLQHYLGYMAAITEEQPTNRMFISIIADQIQLALRNSDDFE